MTLLTLPERVLFVHAHPDDETISTGGTIATLIDAGSSVIVVTCTRGERGEVIPPELHHLSGDALGAYRETELAAAMRALGVTDHRYLGDDDARADSAENSDAPRRFLDSGMQWGPEGAEPLAPPHLSVARTGVSFTEASLDVLIADLTSVMREIQPTAVISYDSRGGYGHPDHVRAHEVAGMAALLMNVPFFIIVAGDRHLSGDITVDIRAVMDRKKRALAAYRTQLTLDGDTIVHSGGQREPITTVEAFRRLSAVHETGMEWKDLRWFSRVSAVAFAFLIGAVIGAVGTVHHGIALGAISLLISGGFLVGLRLLLNSRVVAGAAALGMLLIVGIFSLESPGGSVLIQANDVGFVWSYALPVMAIIVLAWPRAPKRSRDTMVKESDSGKAVGAS